MLLNFDKLFKHYNMNVTGVIHIGAHYGEEYEIYLRYDTIKEMYFFEPDPDSFRVLQENIKGDPKTKAFNIALGSKRCLMNFYKSSNQGESSSLLKPLGHLEQYPQIKFKSAGKIEVDELDNFVLPETLNMINIDVQGFEMEVFKGAKKTLNQIKYIIAEVNRSEVYKNCCMVADLDSFLGGYGFIRMDTTWEGITWGDALYIKGDVL